MNIFAKRLKELRLDRNLMQKDVADCIGITPQQYQRYEYGKQEPTLSKLTALADFYKISIDELVGRKIPEN